jgi:hypothetical protein
VSCGPGWSLWGWPVSCCSAASGHRRAILSFNRAASHSIEW